MKHLFIMDPIASIDIDADSTFALMLEAKRRGHTVLYSQVEDLYLEDGEAKFVARAADVRAIRGDHVTLGPAEVVRAEDLDVVWMRKDPPFDMSYIFATLLLDFAHTGATVVNAPLGLRNFNEKVWALQFTDIVPPSIVTQSVEQLRSYCESLGTMVVKPLDGNGGAGVFILRSDDPNIGVILELSTEHGARKVLAQRYQPEIREGDKRIILVDGHPVGACLRVPMGVDHRGNIHVGARVESTTLTERDLEICQRIGPPLKAAGQVFVGIDVIGDYLTEVNVTSPTCIHEINRFDGIKIEALVMDAVMDRVR